MKKRNYTYVVVTTGFAVFSMFFGSGNLVFPLALGQHTLSSFFPAFLGLSLTAIFIPLMGLMSLLLLDGQIKKYFSPLGKHLALVTTIIVLLLIGPLGGIPRCITVTHGTFLMLAPHVSLLQFSLMAIILVFICTFDQKRIIPLLGTFLTPFLLLSLALILIIGIWEAPTVHHSPATSNSFWIGMRQGYQTMDLLAAIFFAPPVVLYMHKKFNRFRVTPDRQMSMIAASFIISALLLGLVYGAFVYLGASYSNLLDITHVEMSLALITSRTMGPYAALVINGTVMTACLTTMIILTSVFSENIRIFITKDLVPVHILNIITLLVAFGVSTFQFDGIATFLSPSLEIIYPLIILLTLGNIGIALKNRYKLKKKGETKSWETSKKS